MNPETLKKFSMPNFNTCWATGTPIEVGDPVYAQNDDEVRNGLGVCEAYYLSLLPTSPEPTDESATGDSDMEAGSASKRKR